MLSSFYFDCVFHSFIIIIIIMIIIIVLDSSKILYSLNLHNLVAFISMYWNSGSVVIVIVVIVVGSESSSSGCRIIIVYGCSSVCVIVVGIGSGGDERWSDDLSKILGQLRWWNGTEKSGYPIATTSMIVHIVVVIVIVINIVWIVVIGVSVNATDAFIGRLCYTDNEGMKTGQ